MAIDPWEHTPRLLQELCEGHGAYMLEVYRLDYASGSVSWMCKSCWVDNWHRAGRPAQGSARLCVVCPRRGEPRLYQRASVCEACRVWLPDQLVQVVDYYAMLPDTLERGSTGGQRVSGGSGEARLPFVEDVWDLTRPVAGEDYESVTDFHGDQVGYVSVATTLDRWAKAWAAGRGLGEVGPGASVFEMAGWLKERVEWACDNADASGVDDFAAELAKLVHTMRRFVDTDTSKPQRLLGVPCRRCDQAGTLVRLGNGEGDVECQNPDCRLIMRADEYDQWTRLAAAHHRRRRGAIKVVDAAP